MFTAARQIADQEQEQILTFIADTYDKQLKLKLPQDHVNDIKDAVYEMIEHIIALLGKEYPKYAISKFYFVGSMAEGTRNSSPSECDFLLVLKHLTGAIEIERVRHMDPYSGLEYDHAHIKINDTNVRDMFSETIDEDGFLHDPCGEESTSFKQHFDKCLNILEQKTKPSIEKETGTLQFAQSKLFDTTSECHGPAFTFELIWQYKVNDHLLFIDVDFSPAIEVEDITTLITTDDVDVPSHFAALKEDGKLLLVPARTYENSKCFKFTFTNTEVKLVRESSDQHKLCQKILKLWCSNFRIELYEGNSYSAKAFSSYHIKTCLLTHAVTCSNTSVYKCMLDVMSMMSENYVSKKNDKYLYSDLKCIFMKSNSISTRCFEKHEKERIDDFLTHIVKCLVEIGQTLEYDYYKSSSYLEKKITYLEDCCLPHHLFKV